MGAPQELIAGRYRLTRRIAAGGMGVVWEALDELLQRPVAVKQLRTLAGLPEDEAEIAKRRAVREGRITARLHHPNAVVVFDSVEHDGEPCLVMQYVPSEPLSAVLKARGALPIGEVARIGAQVAGALAAAHALGIVHRDVKPGNILIADADGSAMLSDFGISHSLGDATLTSTGLMHGTPAYLAPEVARGEETTFASDVFSLGSTLYAAAEGDAPFGEAPNSIAVLHRVAVGGFPAPQRSGALGALLLRMMADDPAARPAMTDVARQLDALATDEGAPVAAPLLLDEAADLETGLIELDPATRVLPVAAPAAAAAPDEAPTLAAPVVPPAPPVSEEPEPEPEPGRRRRRGGLVALVVVAVLLLGGLGLARVLLPTTSDAAAGPTASGAAGVPSRASAPASSSPASAPASRAPASGGTPSASTPASPSTPPSTAPTRSESPSAPPSAPATPSTDPGGGATAAASVAAISSYYGLVPRDTSAAWSRLTSGYQSGHAGGRASFERFWGPIASVSASDVTATSADGVRARIVYRYSSGRVVTEETAFGLAEEGGELKIASSTVLSHSG